MPRFVIDIGDIELSKEAAAALSTDLQKVALGHLAGLRFDEPLAVRLPRKWNGMLTRLTQERLELAEKDILAGIGEMRVGGARG